MAKPKMSEADRAALFEPTAAERESVAARAKANAAKFAPKDTSKTVTVRGIQNPLKSAFQNAQPANKTSPVEDVVNKVKSAVKRFTRKSPSTIHRSR